MGRSRSRARTHKPKLGYTTTPTDDDENIEDFQDEVLDQETDGKKTKSEMVPINDDPESETVENVIQAELNRIPSGGDLQSMEQDEAHFKHRAKRRNSFGSTQNVNPDLMSRFASSKSRHRRRSSSRDRELDEAIQNDRVRANDRIVQEEYQQNMQFRRKMGYSDHPAPVPSRHHDEFLDEHQSQYSDYNAPRKVDHVVVVHELKMNRRKKVFAFVVFLTVLASIGIILVATNRQKKNPGVSAMAVPEPPSNIGDVCSAENVSTKDGRDKCNKICRSASCCMASGENSCFLQNEDSCGMYVACGNLHLESDITDDEVSDNQLDLSQPPSNIDEVCSTESLKTVPGYIACENACEKGKCCFVDDDFKEKSQPFIIKSCKKTNPVLCEKYSPCDALASNNPSSSQKPNTITDKEVDEKCSQANLDTGMKGFHECENICQSRSCCFAKSQTRNCRRNKKEWCDEYSACQILESSKSDADIVVLPPADIKMKNLCKESSTLSDHDRVQCTESCQLAKCCLFLDFTCANTHECQGYEYCGEFLTVGLSPNNKPKSKEMTPLERTCADLSTVASQTNCRSMCNHGMCCFDYGPKGCSNEAKCTNYGPCQQLISLGLDFDDTGIDGSDALMHDVKVVPTVLVEKACAISNIVEESGLDECLRTCKDYMCCFDYTANGCALDSHCPKYASCAILTDQNVITIDAEGYDVKKDVDDVCSIDKIMDPNNKGLCAALCEPHRCCFNEECHKPECAQYSACGIVMNEHPSPNTQISATSPIDDLAVFCDAQLVNGDDPFYKMQCEDMCRSALCCIARDGDCRDKNSFCTSYTLCDVVWKDIHGTTVKQNIVPIVGHQTAPTTVSAAPTPVPTAAVEPPPKEVGDPKVDCSIDNLMTAKDKCLKTCEPFKCCWSKNASENCYDKYQNICLKYIYCPDE